MMAGCSELIAYSSVSQVGERVCSWENFLIMQSPEIPFSSFFQDRIIWWQSQEDWARRRTQFSMEMAQFTTIKTSILSLRGLDWLPIQFLGTGLPEVEWQSFAQ